MLNVQRSLEIWFANHPRILDTEWVRFRILGVERSWQSALVEKDVEVNVLQT
jgi:hypothetical protein